MIGKVSQKYTYVIGAGACCSLTPLENWNHWKTSWSSGICSISVDTIHRRF